MTDHDYFQHMTPQARRRLGRTMAPSELRDLAAEIADELEREGVETPVLGEAERAVIYDVLMRGNTWGEQLDATDQAVALRTAAEILGAPHMMERLRRGSERLWIEQHDAHENGA